jgi:hypothetical protein
MSSSPTIADLTISIIAIDRPGFFEDAVRSLIDTTPAGATLQLTLNAIGPETREIAEWALGIWDGPTSLIETPRPLDFVDAHNLALGKVSTPFVNFMGDDDLNLRPRFERQLSLLKDEHILAVGTFAYRIGARANGPTRKFGRMDLGPVSRDEMVNCLEADQPIYLVFPSVVARTRAVRDSGGLRPVFGPAADIDLWTRLAERGIVIAIPERLIGFRVHDGAGSTLQFFEAKKLTRYAQACQSARRRLEREPSLDEFLENRGHIFTRVATRLSDLSRYYFRRAGAAWLEVRPLRFVSRLFLSFLFSPVACCRKLRDQLGRIS